MAWMKLVPLHANTKVGLFLEEQAPLKFAVCDRIWLEWSNWLHLHGAREDTYAASDALNCGPGSL